VWQLAEQVANQQSNSFSTNTEANPKEQCKVVVTRSDKEVGLNAKGSDETKGKPKDRGECKDDEEIDEEIVVEKEENKSENKEKEKKKEVVTKPPLVKTLPYPLKPSKKDKERQFARFLDIFKRLQINIPFSEALEQIPTYAKFMKEISIKKIRFIEEETIELEAECSAIFQKMLPPKLKDPGSFTLPVTIGSLVVGKTLLDLGANINMMPLSMIKKIEELEIKPTQMTLQFRIGQSSILME